jgi:hypothetical protein
MVQLASNQRQRGQAHLPYPELFRLNGGSKV